MSERNYWTRMRSRRLSRRTLLVASSRAGVGAAGLALVGCGDDDDDEQQAVMQAQQQQEEQQQAMQQQQQAMQQQQPCSSNSRPSSSNSRPSSRLSRPSSRPKRAPLRRSSDAEPEVDLDATLRLAIGRYTAGLDPQRSGSQTNYVNGACTFDWDVQPPDCPTAALEPNLVQTVEVVDPTNLIMHVAQGINFHNGTPYTAHDLQFNFERRGQGRVPPGRRNQRPSQRLGHGPRGVRRRQLRQLQRRRRLPFVVETPAPRCRLDHVRRRAPRVQGVRRGQRRRARRCGQRGRHRALPLRRSTSPMSGSSGLATRITTRVGTPSPGRGWPGTRTSTFRSAPSARADRRARSRRNRRPLQPAHRCRRALPRRRPLQGALRPGQQHYSNTHDTVAEVDGEPNPFLDIRRPPTWRRSDHRRSADRHRETDPPVSRFDRLPSDALESRTTTATIPSAPSNCSAEAGYPDGDVDLHRHRLPADCPDHVPGRAGGPRVGRHPHHDR